MTDQDRQSSEQKRPAETLRDGKLKATLWRQEGDRSDYHTARFAKLYEDRDGNLQETQSFTRSDLLGLAELARKSRDWIMERDREQFKEQRQQSEDRNRGRTRAPRQTRER